MQNLYHFFFPFNSQIKSTDDQAQKENFTKGAKKSVEAGVCRTHWACYLRICVFCVQTFTLFTISNFLLLCVCVRVRACREPAERAGTKAGTDREDAQLHPHPAGPAH